MSIINYIQFCLYDFKIIFPRCNQLPIDYDSRRSQVFAEIAILKMIKIIFFQIFYTDLSDVNGYAIYLNSQIVLQCIISTFSLNVTTKSNTCYTGGVIKCNAGDIISIKTMDVNRKVMLESTRSFVGMFKIGEFQNLK